MIVIRLLLVCLSIQNVLNIKRRYTVGLIYERGFMGNFDSRLVKSDNFEIHISRLYVTRDNAYQCLNSACISILKYATVGIFGPASKSNVDAIQGVCSARNIPHILTDYVGPLQGKTQLNFYPNIELLTKASIDILSSMEWKQFTFLYTSQEGTSWAKFVEKAQNSSFIFHTEFLDPHRSEQERNIERIKETGSKYFVIDCFEEETMKILFLFQHFGMITKDYHYFFTNILADNQNISSFKFSGVDITKIQLFSSNVSVPRLMYRGYDQLLSVSQALVFDAIHMFANSLESLKSVGIVRVECGNGTRWNGGDELLTHMLSGSHKGITGEIRFGPDRYRDTFELFISKLERDGMKEVGTWNKLDGAKYIESLTKEETVSDWRSKPLVVVTSLKQPYVMIKETVHSLHGNDRYQGFVVDLLEDISKIANFSYTIVIKEGGSPVQGMIEDIQMEKADLAVLDISITSERVNIVDFTHPIMYTGISILFQKPLMKPPTYYYFARPFTGEFLAAIGVAFVSVTISLFVVGRLCNNEWKKPSPKSKYSINQLTFLNTVWFAAGSLFRQNTQVKIRSIPGRTIAAAWWLFCFLVIAMYIAALITHTVNYEKHVLFSDVQSLVENAKEHGIQYGALNHGSTMNFFKDAYIPLYEQIYQHMSEHQEHMVLSIDEGVARAEMTRYAFFTEETTIDYVTQRHCQLAKYGGLLNEYAYGIALRRNSSYLHSLNMAILKLSNMGKLAQLKRKWWEHGQGAYCVNAKDDEIEEINPVEMVHVIGLIQITLLGVTLALISAVIEFIFYIYRKSKKLNTGFFQVFKKEIRYFKGNTKATIDPNFINRPVPEDEEHATTSEAIELT